MFKPYEGNEPYIFASYCHTDRETVLPLLEVMDSADYRVWYDEGISPASKWTAEIEDHISRCTVCIAFLSAPFVESKHCQREVELADNRQKVILPVYLEKGVELKYGLDLLLHKIQRINYSDIAEFMQKIRNQAGCSMCKKEAKKAEQEKPQGNDKEQTDKNVDIKTVQAEDQNDEKAQSKDNQTVKSEEISDYGDNGYDTFLSKIVSNFRFFAIPFIPMLGGSIFLIMFPIFCPDFFTGEQIQTDMIRFDSFSCSLIGIIIGLVSLIFFMNARHWHSYIQPLLDEAPYEAQWYQIGNTLFFTKYKQDGTSIYWHTYPRDSWKKSRIRSARIEDGIKIIKGEAFDGFGELSSVFISDSVQIIEEGAFGGCKSLKKVSVSAKTKIEDEAFPPWVKPEIRPERSEEEENVPPPPD